MHLDELPLHLYNEFLDFLDEKSPPSNIFSPSFLFYHKARLERETCVRLHRNNAGFSPYAIILYILACEQDGTNSCFLYIQQLKSFPPNPTTGLSRAK